MNLVFPEPEHKKPARGIRSTVSGVFRSFYLTLSRNVIIIAIEFDCFGIPIFFFKRLTMFDSPDYKRTRLLYKLECTFEYFVALLVADSFLARLLSRIGMSDVATGVVSSFISLTFLFQLLAVPVVRKITNTKRFAVTIHLGGQLCFMLLYLVPFISVPNEAKQFVAVVMILVAYFGNYFVNSIIYRWGNSFVDPKHLASFSSSKELLSLLSGITVQLLAGVIIDRFVDTGNIEGSFIFCAVSIFVFAASDFVCLLMMKKEKAAVPDVAHAGFGEVIRNTVGRRSFRSVVLLSCLVKSSIYASVGFLGIYKIKELALTMTSTQIINIICLLGRSAISIPFGKYTDRTSYRNGAETGILIMIAGYIFLMFVSPGTRWLIIAYSMMYHISLAGTNSNLLNLTYDYVDRKYFAEAFAIKNAAAGLCGFLVSVACGSLLAHIQENGNVFLGIHVYGQQVLATISAIIGVMAFLYSKLILSKQPLLSRPEDEADTVS